MYHTLSKSIQNLIKFDGAGSSRKENAGNQRADGYLCLQEFIDNEFLRINDKDAIAQLEYIKIDERRNGKIYIQAKKDMKSENGESPDNADSLMMGIYALNYHSDMATKSYGGNATVMLDTSYDPFD